MDIKEQYAKNHSKVSEHTLLLNSRLFSTYNRIALKLVGSELTGVNIDLGSGDKGFSVYCSRKGICSHSYDYPNFDIEQDLINQSDNTVDFVTMNAVIEHIQKPEHILLEIKRVLKQGGLLFIRTPNWQMDFKNFYNDPTHVTPYSPIKLKNTLELAGFKSIFIEPGLIGKSFFWWKLHPSIKWKIASLIHGGTKSILGVARAVQVPKKK
ncbi:class I SAM-dependent methyltransferase [Desulfocicer niacini]